MAKRKKKRPMTDKELRDYYDTHSILEENTRIRPVHITFPKPRLLIALRLEEKTLDGIKLIAAKKGLNFSTLVRMWITERLQKESA
ncbi:MAG: hypothetical protein KGJ84_13065 [Elusimicrobia bacterium]|nr:hypothetical protein [Elusimicrobiota bacterium]